MSENLPLMMNRAGSLSNPQRADYDTRLRGCRLSTILMDRSFLRSVKSREDAAVTSVLAGSIDFFLSHSWYANGFWKQVALFLCCSTTSTYIIALIPSSLVAAHLLYVSIQNGTGLGWTVNGFDLTVFTFGFASFLLGIFIIPLFKHRNTMVFLDKCCIPQNDPIAKSYGISRLADYLRVSNKLLILWSPDYLERLWCVYELAVFLRTHKKEDVILVNLNHLKLCMSLMIVQSFSIVTLLLIEPWEPDLVYIVCVMAMIASALLDRWPLSCSEEWQKFRSEVKRFSVRRAKCSASADYDTLKQLITDMYGSEESFAAVVRGIWLGEGEDNNHSTCLLSRTSLRVICAPYIPLLIARISWVITLLFPPQLDGDAVSFVPLYDVGVMREDLPSTLEVFMWEVRTSIIPILMLCFRAPLLLLAGHKLATSSISERVAKWHLGIIHALLFSAYIILTRMVCGWQNFYFPLRRGLMDGPMGEVLHWAYSVAAVTVISSVLSKSYARNP